MAGGRPESIAGVVPMVRTKSSYLNVPRRNKFYLLQTTCNFRREMICFLLRKALMCVDLVIHIYFAGGIYFRKLLGHTEEPCGQYRRPAIIRFLCSCDL